MRSVVAIVVGYLVFGVSSAILFAASGQDPRVLPTPGFLVCSIVYGAAFAAFGGYLAARIANCKPLLHAGLVAAIIATGAIVAMIVERQASSLRSQIAVLFVMAPAALAGGISESAMKPEAARTRALRDYRVTTLRIKAHDPENTSRRHASYVPFWA